MGNGFVSIGVRAATAGVMVCAYPPCMPLKRKRPGFSILYRLRSRIKTPITNTIRAMPNSAVSIRVMTPTVYLPALDPYAL
jgi:hypothetical protein